jgi:hypothetical protein
MKPLVLDAYSLAAFLERRDGSVTVLSALDACIAGESNALLSTVSWSEFLFHVYHTGGEKLAREAQSIVAHLPITIVPADAAIASAAAEVRLANLSFTMEESFAISTALKHKAILLFGRRHSRCVGKMPKMIHVK